MSVKKTKLWTKRFFASTVVNFLILLNYYLLMVVMTSYAIDHFHVDGSIAGLASSLFIIGTLPASRPYALSFI